MVQYLTIAVARRMIDDDDVGLKEKPEDTRYIQRLHRNETRNTGSVISLPALSRTYLIIDIHPKARHIFAPLGLFMDIM